MKLRCTQAEWDALIAETERNSTIPDYYPQDAEDPRQSPPTG